tara:strand:- start:8053 stop:9930 length:1878 start_codon:yes stop_codon:yes gene_type:complete
MKEIKKFFYKITKFDSIKRRLLLIFVDYLVILFAGFLSFSITKDSFLIDKRYLFFLNYISISSVLIYALTKQYKSLTRYFESTFLYILTLRNLLIISFLIIFSSVFLNYDISIFFWFLFLITSSFFVGGTRLILRDILIKMQGSDNFDKENIVIYGAGSAGAQLAKALKNSGKYKLFFIVDDDPNLWNRNLGGIKIYSLEKLINFKKEISKVLLAMPSVSKSKRSEICNNLQDNGFKVLSVNSLDEIVQGKVKIDSLKPINIEDLLCRDSVSSDPRLLGPGIVDKSVCVVGAGGSIGSELSRQIIKLKPKKLILVEMCEHNLYKIIQELKLKFPKFTNLKCILGNVLNDELVTEIFLSNKIDVVFHAAAYKHVPIVEDNPMEGLLNNVFSTKILCEASKKYGVSEFILLSTDKAVRPTNVMGASKRLSELIVQAYADLDFSKNSLKPTKFSMVRFGNVLNSSGSVVPLFKKQIAEGGPISITHKEVTRYFMTIEEASQLVIQAAVIAKGGDVFLLDMGQPIKILDLAHKMINLSGNTIKNEENINGDIEIIFTGLRKGEKIYEELLIDAESVPTINPLIFTAKEKSLKPEYLFSKLDLLKRYLKEFNKEKTFNLLSELVPEWNQS